MLDRLQICKTAFRRDFGFDYSTRCDCRSKALCAIESGI